MKIDPYKELLECLRWLHRTSNALQNTLGQDLSPLLPAEQEKILANAVQTHQQATVLAGNLLQAIQKAENDRDRHAAVQAQTIEGRVNGTH